LTTEVAVAAQRDAQKQADHEEEREVVRPQLWSDARIDPVEIALPKGVGYTLRAYRLATEITPTDVSARESDEFPDRQYSIADQDEEFDFGDAFDDDPAAGRAADEDDEPDDLEDEDDEGDEDEGEEDEDEEGDGDREDDLDEDEDEEEEDEDAAAKTRPEEVT
jgi:hypothetical protein